MANKATKSSRLMAMSKHGRSLSSLSADQELLPEGAALTRRDTAGMLAGRSFESVLSPSAYTAYDDNIQDDPLYDTNPPASPSQYPAGGYNIEAYAGQGGGEVYDDVTDLGGGIYRSHEKTRRDIPGGSSGTRTRSKYCP